MLGAAPVDLGRRGDQARVTGSESRRRAGLQGCVALSYRLPELSFRRQEVRVEVDGQAAVAGARDGRRRLCSEGPSSSAPPWRRGMLLSAELTVDGCAPGASSI